MQEITVDASIECHMLEVFEDDAAKLQGIPPGTYSSQVELGRAVLIAEFTDQASAPKRQLTQDSAYQIFVRSSPTPLTVRGDFLRHFPNGTSSGGVLAVVRSEAPDQLVAAFAIGDIIRIVQNPGN